MLVTLSISITITVQYGHMLVSAILDAILDLTELNHFWQFMPTVPETAVF